MEGYTDILKRKNNRPRSVQELMPDIMELKKKRREEIKIADYSEWFDSSEKGKIKLPDNVKKLIQNPIYQNRVKYLVREFGSKYIKLLAQIAQTKAKPQHWFAKCYSKERWKEQTLPFLKRMLEQAEKMKEKLAEIKTNTAYLPFFIKAEGKLGESVFNELLEVAMSPKIKNADFYLRGCIKKEYAKLVGK